MKYYLSITAISVLMFAGNAFAATYYVKPDGDDYANGKSHANAWKSLKKIKRFSAKKGDDVYLLAGATWTRSQLTVKWSGTEDNRTIIGSYYMKEGKETIGVPRNTTKPTIEGSYTGPCPNEPGSCINSPIAVPEKAYSGLVKINANYVTIQNLRITHSAGRGIVLNKKLHHAIVEHNEIHHTAGNSVIFSRGTSYNIMRNNDTSHCAIGWKQGDWIAVSKTWPTCNSAVNSHHNIFEDNYIHESFGEGIVMLRGSRNNLVRGNTIAAVRSTNIYIDNSSSNIIENNLLVGARDSQYTYNRQDDGHKYGGGIDVKVESYKKMYDSINNVVRNNLLVRTGGLLMGLEKKAEKAGKKIGVKFINNTLIETATYVKLHDGTNFYDSVEIYNNIFSGSKLGPKACKITPTNTSLHHNHWDILQADIKCQDKTTDKIGNPRLKRNNWNEVGPDNLPTPDDFSLSTGSTALKTGQSFSNQDLPIAYPNLVNNQSNCKSRKEKRLNDFNCNTRTAPLDMGAMQH